MANTTADKLAKLEATKAALKAAINDPALGEKFSDYPVAVTDGKAYITEKITAKGVPTSADATFKQIGDNVGLIQTLKEHTITNNAFSLTVNSRAFAGQLIEMKAEGKIPPLMIETEYLGKSVPYIIDSASADESIYHFFMPDDNITIN